MTTILPHFRVLLILLASLAVTAAGACFPLTAKSAEIQSMPEHTISISFDLGNTRLTGTSKITLPPQKPLNIDCGPLDVTAAVLEVMGKAQLTLVPDGNNRIGIPPSDSAQTVYISWELSAANPYATGNLIGDQGITLAGFWHPVPDIDMHYSLEAELPDNFTGISEGETLRYCKDKYNVRYLTTNFAHPIRNIHFAAGPYTVKYRTLDDGIELAAFFFEEDLGLADEYLEKAASYIQRYEKLIGPFPYNRYSIVENRLPTGYGMPTFTLLGQAVVRLPFIKDTSLGHEILHSWFGNSVFLKESSGNWTEGLTTYLADQLYAEDEGKGAEYRKNQLLRYLSYVPQNNEMTLEDFSNASDSQPMARMVRAIGYDKSSMVFHMLRKQLGEEAFFQGLAAFYQKMKFKRAGWEDIEDIFTQSSGTDLTDFFDQWLTRWDLPRFTISNIDIDPADGRSKITFTVEQKTVQPYSLLLPIIVETRTGKSFNTLALEGPQSKGEIIVDELPVSMTIDPDYDLMRDLNEDEIPPVWSFFIGAENKTAVLASRDEEQIYAPLIEYLKSIGCETVTAEDLDSTDLLDGSFLFLGSSALSRGLFADPEYPQTGFTLDTRRNPLAPHRVMVLVRSSDGEETSKAARKLSHYGKYSYLHFQDGQLEDDKTAPADNGLIIDLFAEPKGIAVPEIKTFENIIGELEKKRVVYVGEIHTDMGSHILQLQVIQALYENNPNLAVGMEMFPRSSQQALDGYINGTIATEKEFLKKSKYFDVWGFDYRYYREIINFAKVKGIPLVALNLDKEIVSNVFKEGGVDGLDEEQSKQIPADRDLDVPGYSARLAQAFTSHDSKSFDPEKMSGFLQAQSIWDETMAANIVAYLHENPERRMVVVAGNGHVYKDSAIPIRVQRRMDVPQSVLVSINHESTGMRTGYKVDFLIYSTSFELQPSPKFGLVLQEEKISETSDETRVRVAQISPHGKAGEAGIKTDDIILSVDGEKIADVTDLKISVLDKKPGDKVSMKLLRKSILFGDREIDVDVELVAPMDLQGNKPPEHP